MSFLLRLLDTDSISLEVYGFWGSVRRRLLGFLPYRFRNWWTNHVRTIYAPQHSNLRRAIPKTWRDLDGCIENFLFACVISFVEDEDGLDDWEQPCQEGPRKEQAAMLREVYDWAKTGRQVAEDAMFAAAPRYEGFLKGLSYNEMSRLSDEMEAKTNRYILWITTYRVYLWV